MRPSCIQILFPVLMTISVSSAYSQSNPSHPAKASKLKKMESSLFYTDFGYEEQEINFKNLKLCSKYFHYKIFGYQGLDWQEMKIEERADLHYYLDGNHSKFHIVFMNFDKKSSKIYFTVGKPPNYFYTGNVFVKHTIDPEYLHYFDISRAYTLSIPADGFHSTEYMIVFYTFMIPNNHYLESNVLLLCKTADDKFSHSILPGKQISVTPYCFIDYNKDGCLDYIHFNPFDYPEPKVSFYNGNLANFTINPEFYGLVTPAGDYLFELNRSKSNLPISTK